MPKSTGTKRRSPLWARLTVLFGALLLIAGGGSVVGIKVLASSATKSVDRENLLGTVKGTTERQHADIKGAKNILLVGLDTRPSWSTSHEPSRSDSIIILHIPADKSRAYLISLPRDSYVSIPAYNNGVQSYPGGKDKINSAFAFGSRGLDGAAAESHGFELLAKTIKNLTGITPDAGAIIDFSGFTKVLQILGKVCMYVDENVTSIHVGHTADGKQAVPYKTDAAGLHPRHVPGVTPNVYKKGNHCFTPTEALDYARQRDFLSLGDSDYGRQRHQQQLLKAILGQAVKAGFDSPTKLPSLISAIGKAMTVDDGGISLEDWAFAMKGINPDSLVTIKTNDGKFNSRSVSGIGSVEVLSPTTMQLLKSARTDTVDQFVANNPSWVASS
ncbi:LCP family protein [Actinoplanes sp. NPDC051411]|uniref:LCP family protein n=1 Tax=Actinoplanes sp. NPDC051411 TaxID=3155522 RepID=UPI00344536A6